MKLSSLLAGALLVAILTMATHSQTPPAPAARIAVIDMQAAIAGTREGRQALLDLQTKFEPLRAALEKKEADLQVLQDQLQKGAATMNDESKLRLERHLEAGNRAAKHESEDLSAEAAGDQAVAAHELKMKMAMEVEKFATQNGYAAVLDLSSQENQVVWAPPAANITAQMIKRYDQSHPAVAR
ncbi:putative Outer membrane chaperone Skp (OmpH) [Candidatus Sulfopaludibacter sp. SbA3]|nr:putative Outer membrane chaperone Skp (OmpH) [Candidatus Sulfopaludibacter sp. SbA3]